MPDRRHSYEANTAAAVCISAERPYIFSMNSKRVPIDGGLPCPKCGKPMQRYRHADDWEPSDMQAEYYKFWDICDDNHGHVRRRGYHHQFYAEAIVRLLRA